MLKEILIPVDNSEYSNKSISLGISLAEKFNSKITGSHIYAAKLHDQRFVEMESGLPPKYQVAEELEKQREVHDTLITHGLEIISDSFLDYFEKQCKKKNIPFNRKTLEGKNYREVIRDIEKSDYSIVIMGALGLGGLEKTRLGSVTSRVVRRSETNVMVVRHSDKIDAKILVGIDGSPQSFAATKRCAIIAKTFNVPLEGVAASDPNFHLTAFRSIANVLSEEAGKIFKFEEQEKLHDEIIDQGLEKIYKEHLISAKKIAEEEGVQMKTTLLVGRAVEEMLGYLEKEPPAFIAVGKLGIHSDDALDIGSLTENLLTSAKCNILVVSEKYTPTFIRELNEKINDIPWNSDAAKRMENVPEFARNMAKKAIVDFAVSNGYKKITEEIVIKARKKMGM